MVRLLLDSGANVNYAENGPGFAPLHIAAENNNEVAAYQLLDRGADINQATDSGRTPLHKASLNGHEAIVHLLARRGANLKQVCALSCGRQFTPEALARSNRHNTLANWLHSV